MNKTAVAIRHVYFEDLGTLEAVLTAADYQIRYCDIGVSNLREFDPVTTGLFVVLGGPIGVYETEIYPFLAEERECLKARLGANRPTIGICLGAQQIAAALGATVAPSGMKEIGFSELSLTAAGHQSPLRHLKGVPVLHWHGDTFAIPTRADHLAATPLCTNQAFALGNNVLALQFHAEADAAGGLEPWLIGHAVELNAAGIDVRALRDTATQVGPQLASAASRVFAEWLRQLES